MSVGSSGSSTIADDDAVTDEFKDLKVANSRLEQQAIVFTSKIKYLKESLHTAQSQAASFETLFAIHASDNEECVRAERREKKRRISAEKLLDACEEKLKASRARVTELEGEKWQLEPEVNMVRCQLDLVEGKITKLLSKLDSHQKKLAEDVQIAFDKQMAHDVQSSSTQRSGRAIDTLRSDSLEKKKEAARVAVEADEHLGTSGKDGKKRKL